MMPHAGSKATSLCFRRRPGAVAHSPPERTIAVIQGWGRPESAAIALPERVERTATGWVLALDAIDQSWEPRAVPLPKER